jgi:hypothetical protein
VVPFETVMRQVTFERDNQPQPDFPGDAADAGRAGTRGIGNLDVTSFHFDLRSAQLDLSLHLYEESWWATWDGSNTAALCLSARPWSA